MFALLSIIQCLTFEEESIGWIGKITNQEGKFNVENINLHYITVGDDAAICVWKEKVEIKVNICDFSNISSNSGACCLWLLSKAVDVRNICSANLFPQYVDHSFKGGCCLSINSALQANVDCASVHNVKHKQKDVYATFWFSNTTEKSRNINQTKCTSMPEGNFACGIVYRNSKSDDKFFILSNSSGDFVNDYYAHKDGSTAEKIFFNYCSGTRGIVYFRESSATFNMTDCILKACTGVILGRLSGKLVLKGWYSDKPLSGSDFTDTRTTEFYIPISSPDCNMPVEEQSQCKSSIRAWVVTSFLITQLYKGIPSCCYCVLDIFFTPWTSSGNASIHLSAMIGHDKIADSVVCQISLWTGSERCVPDKKRSSLE